MRPTPWHQRTAGVIYHEALPVALATVRTINMHGAYVKGALAFLHGNPIDLELRLPQRAPIVLRGTVTRVDGRGGRIEFAENGQTRAALGELLHAVRH
ncbi:hypothetical protein HUS23_11645 [Ectothiorhodospiraceae bacterium 2226]|nr:hypothetical protein HUS23_11645 [Ectothiorhodospiraceae bacterium 2226]